MDRDARLALYTGIIAGASILGSILLPLVSLKFSRYLHYANSFAGATLFATSLMHLIPEVLEKGHELSSEYRYDMLIVCAAFVGIMWMEKLFFHVHHHTVETTQQKVPSVSVSGSGSESRCKELTQNLVGVVAISLHSVIAGISLGSGDTTQALDSVFISIISHKLFAAFAVGTRIFESKSTSLWVRAIPLGVFCLMTPLGVLIGQLSNNSSGWVDLVLDSISAGSFLYMGAADMLDEHESHHHDHDHDHDDQDDGELQGFVVSAATDDAAAHTPTLHIHKYLQHASIVLGIATIALVNIHREEDH